VTKFQLNRPDGPWDYPTFGFRAEAGAILDGTLFDPPITDVDQLGDSFWDVYVGGSAQTGITIINTNGLSTPSPSPTDGSLPVFRRSLGTYENLPPSEWLADEEIAAGLSASYGRDVTPEQFGAVGNGTTDDTAAVQAAIDYLYTIGGGSICFGSGANNDATADAERVYRINGQLVFPDDGHPNMPMGVSYRLYGTKPPQWEGQWRDPSPGGVVLDLRYAGGDVYEVPKIDTRGSGILEIDHLTITDRGTSSNQWIHTTQTTLQIHDCAFLGNDAKYRRTCDQDVIVMGHDHAIYEGAITSGFAGYGAVIERNFFSKIRRAWYGRCWVNNIVVQNNTVSNSCGSDDLVHGAAIELDGTFTSGTLGFCSGNLFQGNTVEVTGYMHGFAIYGQQVIFNQWNQNGCWDAENGGELEATYACDYYFAPVVGDEGPTNNTVYTGVGTVRRSNSDRDMSNKLYDHLNGFEGGHKFKGGNNITPAVTLVKTTGATAHLLDVQDAAGDLFGAFIDGAGGINVSADFNGGVGDAYPVRIIHDSYATPAGYFVNKKGAGWGAKLGDADILGSCVSLTDGTGASKVGVFTGTGSPEGVVTGPIGSLYTRQDGGAGTSLYVKESGTGNTGWAAK
jgi:hypothetical protein